ncbi:MAG: thioesterase family protein [Cytophagales bacterium]|nr:acyl-CoA thioesterase [Bernardetiaceae bacterium]MDW8210609.1 thioesterase family protein [Cytophagales bacterium]
MFTSQVQVRVRYAHTDQMGYVYYGNYAEFFEIARLEALRNIGLNYKELEASGVMMPVYELYSRYLAPAAFDDLLTIKVVIKELPSARITFHYEIFNQHEQLIHIGYTTLVFISKENRKPCRAPVQLLKALQPYFE